MSAGGRLFAYDYNGLLLGAWRCDTDHVAMNARLASLQREHEAYVVQVIDSGFVISRRLGIGEAFDNIVRRIIDDPTDEFVALPRKDEHGHYDSVLIITLEPIID